MAVGVDRELSQVVEIVDSVRNDVGQFGVFGVVPESFDRVQVRGLGQQPLEVEPGRMSFGELTGRAAIHVKAVSDDDDLAPDVLVQVSQEVEAIRRPQIVIPQSAEDAGSPGLRRERQHRHGVQAVVPVPGIRKRSQAPQCPSPAAHRLDHEIPFVEKSDYSLLPARLFLIRRHSLRRHVAMTSSSRSRARCFGCCQAKPSPRNHFQTWSGWCATANCSWIN